MPGTSQKPSLPVGESAATLGPTANPATAPNPWRGPSRWVQLIGFWTVFPFALTYFLDLIWDDPFVFPKAPVALFVVLYWWGWIPLSVLVTWLGRRLPIFSEPAHPVSTLLRNLVLHALICAGIAVLYTHWVALSATVLPEEADVEQVSQNAFSIFEGFGALSQLLYWTILLGCTAWARISSGHDGGRGEGQIAYAGRGSSRR